MNAPSLLIALLVLALVGWLALWARRSAQPPKEGEESKYTEEDRTVLTWVMRCSLAFVALGVLVLIQASGIFNISDPLQGQDARGSLSTYAATPRSAGEAPVLEGVAVQPDVGAVVDTHQDQLRDFEAD